MASLLVGYAHNPGNLTLGSSTLTQEKCQPEIAVIFVLLALSKMIVAFSVFWTLHLRTDEDDQHETRQVLSDCESDVCKKEDLPLGEELPQESAFPKNISSWIQENPEGDSFLKATLNYV